MTIDPDDLRLSPTAAESFRAVFEKRLSRRSVLRAASLAAASATLPALTACSDGADPVAPVEPLDSVEAEAIFTELAHGLDENFHVAPGYNAQVLVRWGDPIFSDAPEFDPLNQQPESQAKQFGFNNDYTGFVPLPLGSDNSDHGLLVVNHEYTDATNMHPGSPARIELNEVQTEIDRLAHGLSVIEIKKTDGQWRLVKDSAYNRRITPYTEMQISGPAAGSERMKSLYSEDGIKTYGTYGNCAGGLTPWGTILTGEENIQSYFAGELPEGDVKRAANYQRFGIQETTFWSSWPRHGDRWNMASNPNEPMHVGWIVEIDPSDPNSVPKKRTALGRFKHEGCNVTINADGYVVGYTGDDQVFEYLYRFVSANKFDPNNRAANMDLLDEGVLSVAVFDETGMNWVPLVYGQGPLTEANGFESQADVVLDARKAADLVGATPMDRPEDVDINPVNGRVYAMLTKNGNRTEEQVNPANPRANNSGGQVLELLPPDGDHTADRFGWELLVVAGDPAEAGAKYHPDTSENGWFACPDNCAFDNKGNIWVATDGAPAYGIADGVWMVPTEGEYRGRARHFLRTPVGAELCGPTFTPNNENFICAVQHPGSGAGTFDNPGTRWPDFSAALPPRPSVVVVTKAGGGVIGS